MSVRVTHLDNGVTVATDEIPRVETVALGVFVGVGTRHEPAELNGASHLLEHMALKGTASRSARDIAEEIESVGGQLNAFTGRETTAFHAHVLKEHTGLALDLLADVVRNPRLDEGELDRERQVVLQEIGQAHDTPDDIIFDHVQEVAFPDQGVGRPVLGRAANVAALTRDDLAAYMRRHYGAQRIVVAAAGKVGHDAFVEMARGHFADMPRTGDEAGEPARYAGGDYREQRDLEQVHLALGLPGVGARDPRYYTAAVLATLLGGGMSSRLFQKVREERGLVYTVFAFHSAAGDSGLFGVYAGTGADEVRDLIPVVCEEIAACAREVSEAELDRARAQLKASILMSQESTTGRCEQLATHILVHGRPVSTDEIVAGIDAVDREAVQGFAAELSAGRPALVGLGPVGEVESLDSVAARFAA